MKKIEILKQKKTTRFYLNKTREYGLVLLIAFYLVIGFSFIKLFLESEPHKIDWPPRVEAQVVTPTPAECNKTELKCKLQAYFGDEWETAYAVAQAESSLDPTRAHKDEKEWSVGLFQINMAKGNGMGAKVHANKIPGETMEDKEAWLMDEDNNIFLAHYLKETGGWNQWTVYSKGTYKKFL